MKKYILKHINYYLALCIMQLVGLFLLFSFSGHRDLQMTVIFISGIAYVSWAILHHYLEHSLSATIVLEYLLFGTFGVSILLLYFK